MSSKKGTSFLQWALPKMGYRWDGFRKPRNQVLSHICDRIQDLGLSGGFDEYKRYLDNHPEEWDTLDKLCDVTISKFFRDRKVWDYLCNEILHGILNDEPASIWSIGCCNGEESYSLAIISEQLTEKRDKNLTSDDMHILASDRNEQVLKRARNGCYPEGALKELTDGEISTYFRGLDDQHEDDYQIEERLMEFVEFEKRDIQDSLPDQTFDLILCRNLVFTYFTEERQAKFLGDLKPRMKERSYLVIGSNESLPKPGWLDVVSETHRVFGVK